MNWLAALFDRLGGDGRPSGDLAVLQRALGPAYRLRGELGRGGMAVVFLADDLRHDRQVAVKVLRQEPGSASTERFLREIRITARLQHPNIVPLFDSGVAGGLPFFVMPRVHGETLRALLKTEGPLDLSRAVGLAATVAAALGYAHRQGVVHRDVKPSNILLSEGTPVVADFGIAHGVLAAGDERLTATGVAVGTPAYMSPEILTGTSPDGRSDLYSLGCVLFEMLAGEPPFAGAENVWRRLSGSAPSIRERRPDLPEWIDHVVTRALQADPEHRFQSAKDFEAAMLAADAPTAPPVRSVSSSPAEEERIPGQKVRFCSARDGTLLAYVTAGTGRPLVKAANWLTHLEYDWASPLWRHWLTELARRWQLVRYDQRGCGLSERAPSEISFESFVADLEAVVAATGLERFPLLGISQGAPIAIEYAVRHPEKVSRLVLHGGYARGRLARAETEEARREVDALLEIIRLGWGRETPAFRQVFTTLFYPDASPEAARSFNEMQAMSTSPENAVRILQATGSIDVRDTARRLRVPTLVVHCQNDQRVSFDEGKLLASLIPGACLVSLSSSNHIPLEHEPAWTEFLDAVTAFLDQEEG